MKVLAIETASPPGSIALLESTRFVAHQALNSRQRTTQQFAAVMQRLLQQEKWTPTSVDLVAVCGGPGSFTGLRIGITAAKTFAYATQAEVLAVNTLELLASQVDVMGQIVAILNAQRGQLFSSTLVRQHDSLQTLEPTTVFDMDDWLAKLTAEQTVTGPGLQLVHERLPKHVTVADTKAWHPRADMLGRLACRKFERGQRQDLWQLKPDYYRTSAAEEKADRRPSGPTEQ